MTTVNNTDYLLHKLRNCHNRNEEERRADRLEAADLIEERGREIRLLQEIVADAEHWSFKGLPDRNEPRWLCDARRYLGTD